jgi:hypothetical protein
MAFSLSTVTGYVAANEKQLIGKAVVAGTTASKLNLQTGVKGSAYLNLMTADPVLADGSACGWNGAGTTTVTRRQISTSLIKINQEFCDKDLIGTALQYDVKVAVGQKTLPFEQEFIGQNLAMINKKLEEIIWAGDITGETSSHLERFDGFIKIIGAASGVVDATVSGKTLLGNTKDALDAIVAALPNEIMTRTDLIIFVGLDVYRKAIKAYQDANLYHFQPADLNGNFETIIPGTNITLVGVHGLTGKNKAYGSYAENLYLGTDLEGDNEKFAFWYSEDNRMFRMAVEFNAGVQVAFPDMVVKYIG